VIFGQFRVRRAVVGPYRVSTRKGRIEAANELSTRGAPDPIF